MVAVVWLLNCKKRRTSQKEQQLYIFDSAFNNLKRATLNMVFSYQQLKTFFILRHWLPNLVTVSFDANQVKHKSRKKQQIVVKSCYLFSKDYSTRSTVQWRKAGSPFDARKKACKAIVVVNDIFFTIIKKHNRLPLPLTKLKHRNTQYSWRPSDVNDRITLAILENIELPFWAANLTVMLRKIMRFEKLQP